MCDDVVSEPSPNFRRKGERKKKVRRGEKKRKKKEKRTLISAAGVPTGVIPTPAALANACKSSMLPLLLPTGVASGVGIGVFLSPG